ncbi:uncharacterized protein LOC135717456 [Ochlerotatus camptorhynchus]|uniref:uncharacterized protein LOC135717456 n=1 Tax=Ochlerotatus camptorhynchus TaxID=644619 RepID=UPI0031CDD789
MHISPTTSCSFLCCFDDNVAFDVMLVLKSCNEVESCVQILSAKLWKFFNNSCRDHSKPEMCALAFLQASYASDDSDVETEGGGFFGFDLDGATGEQFSTNKDELKQFFDKIPGDLTKSTVENTGEAAQDSDDFFNSPNRKKTNKRTKKEILREDAAKRRRLAHNAILQNCDCRKQCINLLSRDDRMSIHESFWNLREVDQSNFIQKYVHPAIAEKRRKCRTPANELRKTQSYKCTLPSASDDPIAVCRKFFLNTLGYEEHCGNIIYRRINRSKNSEPCRTIRGKYTRNSNIRDSIIAHILSYGPTISHYRREHAPNRRYLPSDLSQRAMHKHYQDTHTSQVSYSLYSRVLNEMNISFVKLGHEECEVCVSMEQHKKVNVNNSECTDDCILCSDYSKHLEHAKQARIEYRMNGDTVTAGQLVMAVDLQKVIQLPRLDGLKTIVFSQRILAFNQTFAPVGAFARTFPVVACIWPESVSGRSSSDINSCFHKFILNYGHLEKLTFWLDNCSAQNKNWIFFSSSYSAH